MATEMGPSCHRQTNHRGPAYKHAGMNVYDASTHPCRHEGTQPVDAVDRAGGHQSHVAVFGIALLGHAPILS